MSELKPDIDPLRQTKGRIQPLEWWPSEFVKVGDVDVEIIGARWVDRCTIGWKAEIGGVYYGNYMRVEDWDQPAVKSEAREILAENAAESIALILKQ